MENRLCVRDADTRVRGKRVYGPVKMCKKGCGLILSHGERHCCVEALRDELRRLDAEFQREAVLSSWRERAILAHLNAAQHELRVRASKYHKLFADYTFPIDGLSRIWSADEKGDEMRRVTVKLHRESSTLGFNIVGGRCTGSEVTEYVSDGIFVSKIVENGPAHKGGLLLHDRVTKVNGQNLSSATHDEAVEAFCAAKDPIEIEVQRRITSVKTPGSLRSDIEVVDISTQTDITLQHIEAMADLTSTTAPSCKAALDKYLLPMQIPTACYTSFYHTNVTSNECGREEHRCEELDLERVSTQKLGLAECFKTDDDDDDEEEEEEESGIYVSEIDPEIITDTDGRVRAGDRFIQTGHKEDGCCTDTATILSILQEKDSGASQTDETMHTNESLEQENPVDERTSLSDLPALGWNILGNKQKQLSSDSFLSSDSGEVPGVETEGECFRELLNLKWLMNKTTPLENPGENYGPLADLFDSDKQEIQLLNEELRNVELECLNILRVHRMQQEAKEEHASRCTASLPNRNADEYQQSCRIVSDMHKQRDENSSSDFHTAESYHRSSSDIEVTSDFLPSRKMENGGSEDAHRNQPRLATIQETSPIMIPPMSTKPKTAKKASELSEASLPDTHIPAHAQRYRSYMQLVQLKTAVDCVHSEFSPEWKVCRDGTRYLTKRPARGRLLKERAFQIREERHGATTDDDAASELKLGRHWSKEERKRHVARAKEHRQRREGAQQEGRLDGRDLDIIQLSHKKMMKKRSRKILDSWMTIQELLAHGVKSPDGTRLYNPLLTVTTV